MFLQESVGLCEAVRSSESHKAWDTEITHSMLASGTKLNQKLGLENRSDARASENSSGERGNSAPCPDQCRMRAEINRSNVGIFDHNI